MKYQCESCDRIWPTRRRAVECCEPAVRTLPDTDCVACPVNGETCANDDCWCGGTGWMTISAVEQRKRLIEAGKVIALATEKGLS